MQSLRDTSPTFDKLSEFIDGLTFESVPTHIVDTASLLILDLIGVLAAASPMEPGRIARDHAVKHWAAGPGAPSAALMFDARRASLPGAAFAHATQIDNLDAHDGWQPSKGHAGAALLPALCAWAADTGAAPVSGREAILGMVIGYEVAYRSAHALHATVDDYHTSGAWNALGATAIGARLRSTPSTTLRHALGIAEYHAPRSQMLREMANPSMLHDGSGFGAPVGVYALLIAEDGFTGSPAATVEFDDAAFAWDDLGAAWLTGQQYFKMYPVCRWAHAPIDAALELRDKFSLTPRDITAIDIDTFEYSADLFGGVPDTSAVAQYALAWPVAAALARGRVGVDEVTEACFGDQDLIDLTHRTKAHTVADLEGQYPQRRLANLRLTLADGRTVESGVTEAGGGPDPQPTADEIIAKYRAFTEPVLGVDRSRNIERAVFGLSEPGAQFARLTDLLVGPVNTSSSAQTRLAPEAIGE